MIVDDVYINREVISRMVKKMNHDVEMVTNGREAVDLILLGKKYFMIWMDEKMPVMNGHDAIKEIRGLGYRGIIIGLTGDVNPESIERMLNCGANKVLSKPVTMNEVFSVINYYLQ